MTLKDTDPMPWGKYKGVAMANIPADYLLWVYQQSYTTQAAKPVNDYILDNLDVLKKETKR